MASAITTNTKGSPFYHGAIATRGDSSFFARDTLTNIIRIYMTVTSGESAPGAPGWKGAAVSAKITITGGEEYELMADCTHNGRRVFASFPTRKLAAAASFFRFSRQVSRRLAVVVGCELPIVICGNNKRLWRARGRCRYCRRFLSEVLYGFVAKCFYFSMLYFVYCYGE